MAFSREQKGGGRATAGRKCCYPRIAKGRFPRIAKRPGIGRGSNFLFAFLGKQSAANPGERPMPPRCVRARAEAARAAVLGSQAVIKPLSRQPGGPLCTPHACTQPQQRRAANPGQRPTRPRTREGEASGERRGAGKHCLIALTGPPYTTWPPAPAAPCRRSRSITSLRRLPPTHGAPALRIRERPCPRPACAIAPLS